MTVASVKGKGVATSSSSGSVPRYLTLQSHAAAAEALAAACDKIAKHPPSDIFACLGRLGSTSLDARTADFAVGCVSVARVW